MIWHFSHTHYLRSIIYSCKEKRICVLVFYKSTLNRHAVKAGSLYWPMFIFFYILKAQISCTVCIPCQCVITVYKLLALHLSIQDIPKPREATSVAIRMGAFPLRNSARKDNQKLNIILKETQSHKSDHEDHYKSLYFIFVPDNTQSLSGWLLSPWIHIAGHLEKHSNPLDIILYLNRWSKLIAFRP